MTFLLVRGSMDDGAREGSTVLVTAFNEGYGQACNVGGHRCRPFNVQPDGEGRLATPLGPSTELLK